jgi:hypothetical protein
MWGRFQLARHKGWYNGLWSRKGYIMRNMMFNVNYLGIFEKMEKKYGI